MKYKRLFIPNSYVFITVCTYKRHNILIDKIGYLRQSFKYALNIFKFEIIAIVINPNHFHMILKTNDINHSIKNNREADIWQRRYYEHTIHNEEDLNKHIDYIHYNPVKHGLTNTPRDWEFSSFNKFVKEGLYEENWCNFNDKYGLNKMNIE